MTYKTIDTSNTKRSTSLAGVSPGLRRFVAGQQTSLSAGNEPSFPFILRVLLLHAPLLFIFFGVPWVATIHSVAMLFLGLFYLMNDRTPNRVAWVIAYVAGAEILWRGVEAAPVWEYGKYATILLSVLLLAKFRGRFTLWPLLLLALYVPGILIAPDINREVLAFQLAGPFALGIASMAFSKTEFNKGDLQRVFLAVIAPALAMAILVAFNVGTKNIEFSGGGANEEVSQGIGANQVTSALSLGALASFYYIFLAGRDRRVRNLMLFLFILFVITSVLTFSRAGLWNAVGAILAGVLFLLLDRRRSSAAAGIILILGLVGYFVVFPWLDKRTGGTVLARFDDTDSTGRDLLFQIDYQVFLDHPVWGVGVGQSPIYHISTFGYKKNTHTEYSRLLAEHGGFGVAVMILMALVLIARARSNSSNISRAMSVSFTVWALLYMAHSATRLVAPSFAFGIAAARFLPEEDEKPLEVLTDEK